MIGSSHSQLCKKNSCSVKLQCGPLDHNPRKTPLDGSWKTILQNNPKCLLLIDKQMPHEIQFSLLDEIQNRKKLNTRESKEKKIEKKNKRNRVICFDIYVVIFAFLSSTVEVGRG